MSLSFFDDRQYIRAFDATIGVVAYFNKDTLVMKSDEPSGSFFLMSEELTTYYMYEDVVRPTSASLTELMTTFAGWVYAWKLSSTLTSQDNSKLVEVSAGFGKDARFVDERIEGSGTSVFSPDLMGCVLSVGPGVGRCVRQTRAFVCVQGVSKVATVSGTLFTSSSLTVQGVGRIGAFDEAVASVPTSGNGFFFQYDGAPQGGLAIAVRSRGQPDLVVPRTSWNVDHMDGASGFALDAAVPNTFVVSWSGRETITVTFGVMFHGYLRVCHTEGLVRMGGCVPLRWELQGGALGTMTMGQGAGTISTVGRFVPRAASRSFDTGLGVRTVPPAPTEAVPLVSLRLSPAAARTSLSLVRVTLLNLEPDGLARWHLLIGSALVGASFVSPGSPGGDSLAEVSVSETGVTGGEVVSGGYLSGCSPVVVELPCPLVLGSGIDGTPDVATVVATWIRGVVLLNATLEWVESQNY